jgi:vacuolar-type H+-ATPase subunit I/STV1
MAVVEMRKFALLGLKKEQNKILNALQKTKSVEFKQTRDFDFLTDGMGSGSGEDINEKLSRLTFAVNVIEEADRERAKYKDEKGAPKEKKPLFSLRPGITFDEFLSISENEYEIFSYVSEIEAFSAKLSEFKSEITKHFNAAEQMRIYGGIDLPLNTFKDTARAKIMLGTLPSDCRNRNIQKRNPMRRSRDLRRRRLRGSCSNSGAVQFFKGGIRHRQNAERGY